MEGSSDNSLVEFYSAVPPVRDADFATTHWSTVLDAGGTDLSRAAAALERLCRKYWYPVYAFVRKRGSNREQAEDLTQAFFAYLLEKETIKKVDQQKGEIPYLSPGFAHKLLGERMGQAPDAEAGRPASNHFSGRSQG